MAGSNELTTSTLTRALVCGSREWGDAYAILRELRRLPKSVRIVIHSDCRGADTLAAGIAESEGFKVVAVPMHWKHGKDCAPDCNEYAGKKAGSIRNRKMLSMRPDVVLAFHEDIEHSEGTAHMVDIARKAGIEIRIFDK